MKRVFFLLFCITRFFDLQAQTWKQLNDSIGYYYYKTRDYSKTISVAEKAITAAKKEFGENHPEYAMSLNKLAQLYVALEKYEQAIPVFEQTIKIARKTLIEKYPAVYSTVVDGLAGLYGYMGQYEKAEPLYIEAMEIRKKNLGESHPYYGISLANLAGLYNSMGQYKKSETLYIQAIAFSKKELGDKHPTYAARISNLAGVYDNMGEYEKAESLYLKALTILETKRDKVPRDYASILNNLAALYYFTGKYEKAEPLYLEAMAEHKKLVGEFHPLYGSSLNNLGLLYFVIGQYEKAEDFLIRNSQLELATLKREVSVLSEKEKQEYLSNTVSLPQTHNSVVYSSTRPLLSLIKNTFNLQLVLKSFTLTDSRSMLAAVQQSRDTSIRRLLENWQNLKSLLAKQYALPLQEQRKDLRDLEKETEDLEKNLDRQSSVFRNQHMALQVSMEQVQNNLQQDEVAIEFVKFRLFNKKLTDSTMYAAYLLHKNDSVPFFVPLFEEKQLQQLFDSAGTTATGMVNKFYRGLEVKNKNTHTLGKELYKLVWQPLEAYLKGVKKISYSPAGKLYSVAFHALTVDSTTLLMDKYQLQQYASTREVVLRSSENQTTRPGSITFFGNANFSMDSLQLTNQRMTQPGSENISNAVYIPQRRSSDNGTWDSLPGTAEEVKKIKQLFDQNKITNQSFVQTSASEDNLKALNGNAPQILHIATHGFFLPEADEKRKQNNLSTQNSYSLAGDPLLRSGLIFSGGNYAWSGKTPIDGVEDGIATSYEISQLNLSNTELVVLSACETALGDVKGSEGVFGLQRAFKMAGVKKMIVSLWQVPDKETAELMIAFYTYWMKGKTINEAFTQAQGDMRKKYAPFYWAAFVLVE